MRESLVEPAKLLRAGLLDGVTVLLAGAAADASTGEDATPSYALAVGEVCGSLGARTLALALEEPAPAEADVLVYDGAAAFGAAGADARVALRECLDGAWQATHAVANAAFIEPARGGRIVYVAPPAGGVAEAAAAADADADASGASAHADAARAGLENLARTLSIEWARYGVTTVAIAPGARTPAGEVAALCAYLASPAGEYYSGCLLDLRGAQARA